MATNIIRLIALGILARSLRPSDFGLVALATVLLEFIVLVSEGGIGTYVIYYQKEDWEEQARHAFSFNLVTTLIQLGIVAVALPFVPYFFTQPNLVVVLLALTVVFFFRQLGVVPEALVRRQLRFGVLAQRDVLVQFLSAVLSVILAIQGFGIWSLVIPRLIFEPIRVALVFALAKLSPCFSYSRGRWRDILQYTAPLMGSNLVHLVANEGDTVLVGKVLGSQPLGFYNLAWQLSNFVGRNVSAVVSTVAMPALSPLSLDRARFSRAYIRMLRMLAVAAFPALLMMFMLANELVHIIYGPGWQPVALLLQVFIPFTLVRSVTSPASVVYNAIGRTDIGFKFTSSVLPFYIAGIVIGSRYGVVGVALAVSIVRIVSGLLTLYVSMRLIGVRYWDSLSAIVPVFATAAMMAMVLAIFLSAVAGQLPLLPRTITALALATASYLLALRAFARSAYLDLLDVIRSVIQPLRSASRQASITGSERGGAV